MSRYKTQGAHEYATNTVSIIVPVYKVEKYLDECIQSIVNQTYRNIEIILVDDGSPDQCPAMCDEWSRKDRRIKVIHQKNGGLSSARNSGLKEATGKWIVFVDSDDAVSPRLVEALVHECPSETCLTVTAFQRFHTEVPYNDASLPWQTAQYTEKNLSVCRQGMYVWAALYSKALIDKLSLTFDQNLRNLEDVAWNSIYLRYVHSIRCISSPMYYYRHNPTSITSQCSDNPWQITSWFMARSSIVNWFQNKQLTAAQKAEVRNAYRHCQNNIYGECISAHMPYAQFSILEQDALKNHPLCLELLSPPERTLRSCPQLYYFLYSLLFRIRKLLLNRK